MLQTTLTLVESSGDVELDLFPSLLVGVGDRTMGSTSIVGFNECSEELGDLIADGKEKKTNQVS